MSKLLDESRLSIDRSIQIFQFIKRTPLQSEIQVRTPIQDAETVRLLRRGRQTIRVRKADGSETLIDLEDVLIH